jgi:hypothetical protein
MVMFACMHATMLQQCRVRRTTLILLIVKRGSRGSRPTQSDEGQNNDALGNFDLMVVEETQILL